MSLVSTLALLLASAAKIKPRSDDVRATQLQAELADAQRELATQRNLSRHWLGEAQRVIGQKRELERERDMWRERALGPIPLGGQHARPPERGQAQLQWAQWAQSNAAALQQTAMQNAAMQNAMQQQNLLCGQGMLLGAQALDPGMWCNCVPSRAQVWMTSQDGDT